MYENMTYEFLEKRILARVNNSFDKREGAIIFDATAPIAFELAEAYIMAQVILKQTFATTADREYLVLRAAEYNIYPEAATPAEVEGKFSQSVDLGARFNAEKYNFVVKELIDDVAHTYKLECETAGVGGNSCVGNITPITQISGLQSAEITGIITPGEDEEDTEVFRKRYIEALKSKAYGGNGADYIQKVKALNGVGGVKVYRCWNGGGTVKCVVINTQYEVPSAEMVEEVQTALDPTKDGGGYGIAPIGHIVTVAGVTARPIDITGTITPAGGHTLSQLMDAIKDKIGAYLKDRRIEWCTQTDTQYVTVRSAFILSKILEIPNIQDANVSLKGGVLKIELDTDEVPTLGSLSLTEVK